MIARNPHSDLVITATANERLLLAILKVHEVKIDFAAVAEIMGPQCTKRAVQEQIKKLKKLTPADQSIDATPGPSQPKVSFIILKW